jgi:glycosyltransferase involved in cell wall biosynthesis
VDRICVAHDAVDSKQFSIGLSKIECRRRLGLPEDKKIVLYSGHLYSWKGVQTLVDASEYLSDDTVVIFVGGTSYDIATFKKKNADRKRVKIIGWKDHKDIPLYLRSADVLVLPNSSKNIAGTYTSPMKLFEYMASGTPIVSSKIPSIEEILNKSNSVLVKSDNVRELAFGIKSVLFDQKLATTISKQARIDVENYTWDRRAEIISKFIE